MERLAVGRGSLLLARRKMLMTAFVKEKTWLFVGGNIDQGLFWYLIYVRFGVGTWASDSAARWRVHHFWGPGKPWGHQPTHSAYARGNYLQRLDHLGLFGRRKGRSDSDGGNGTRCEAHLSRLWSEFVRSGRASKDDAPGWTPFPSPVLPAPTVINFKTLKPPSARFKSPLGGVVDKGVLDGFLSILRLYPSGSV